MYKKILVPIDGTDFSAIAVEHATNLAKRLQSSLVFLIVSEPFSLALDTVGYAEDARRDWEQVNVNLAERILQEAADRAHAVGVVAETCHFIGGKPYGAIIKAAEAQKCDLIVMASHGRRGLAAILLGSETIRVLTHSAIPVLVIRPTQAQLHAAGVDSLHRRALGADA